MAAAAVVSTVDIIASGRQHDNLSAPYRIVKATATLTDGVWSIGSFSTVLTPPAGRSAYRPMVANDGKLLHIDLPVGSNPDVNADQSVLKIDDVTRSKPSGIWMWGHFEWSPDSDYIVWAYNYLFQPFRTVITPHDDLTKQQRVGPLGTYDPSWHGNQIVAVLESGGDVARFNVTGLSLRHGPYRETGVSYDPYLNPSGNHLVWLTKPSILTPYGGLRTRRLGQPTKTLVPVPTNGDMNSHAHWLDDDWVIWSRLRPAVSSTRWELWVGNVHTGITAQLTDHLTQSHGLSLEFVSTIPEGVTI